MLGQLKGPKNGPEKCVRIYSATTVETSTDSQEAEGHFDRSKHGLEPSIDCQEAVGRF